MTLREELARLIRIWEDSSSRNSLASLAKETGISYNTVRRAAQAEVEPNIQTVTKLSQCLLSTEEQLQLFKRFYPELTVVAQKWAENKFVPLRSEISVASFSQTDFHVFALVSGFEVGISIEAVISETGVKGAASISRLVDGGAIVEEGNLLRPKASDTMLISDKDALAAIGYIVEAFDLDRINLKGSFYGHRFIGLSDRGVDLAHKILWDALAAIDGIKRDNPGTNVMAYGLLSTFIHQAKTEV